MRLSWYKIHLKNGNVIKTNYCWEEDGVIKFKKYGGTIGISKARVKKIVYTKTEWKDPEPETKTDVEDLKKEILKGFSPRNDVEKACLGTVAIRTTMGAASGFFITEDGHILTNRHVIKIDEAELEKFRQRFIEEKEKLLKSELSLNEKKRELDEDEKWFSEAQEVIKKTPKRSKSSVKKLNDLIEECNSRLPDYYKRQADYKFSLAKYKWEKERFEKLKKAYDEKERKRSSQNGIIILLMDGTELDVSIVSISDQYDLALLKLDGYRTPFLIPGNPYQVARGDTVFAIGNPTGELENSVSEGVLSGYRGEYIQSDARIYPGNSGGPLITKSGRVIGINTFKKITYKFEGLGYALSIKIAIDEFRDILGSSYQFK